MENRTKIIGGKYVTYSDMCQLISMFLRLPDERLVEGLVNGSLRADVQEIFTEMGVESGTVTKIMEDLDEYRDNTSPDLVRSVLRQEYTRLFSHPRKPAVHIYEALYLWDAEEGAPKPSLFISPAAMDAERCYKKAGLTRSKEVNESADHFATQMEFLMYLFEQLAATLQENEEDRRTELLDILDEFLTLHVVRWAPTFFDACITASENRTMEAFWQIGKIFFTDLL